MKSKVVQPSKLENAKVMRPTFIFYIQEIGKSLRVVVYSAVFIGIHEKYLLISFSWLELDEFVSMRECEPVTIDGHS